MDRVKYESVPQEEEPVLVNEDEQERDEDGEAQASHIESSEAEEIDDEQNSSKEKLTREDIKFKTVTLTEKKLLLRELINEGSNVKRQKKNKKVSSFQVAVSGKIVRLKVLYLSAKDESQTWGIWKGHMKQIGGQFGNGVLSFFTFLRWLFYLNFAIGLITLIFLTVPTVSFTATFCMKRVSNQTIKPLEFARNMTSGNETLKFYDANGCRNDDPRIKNYVFKKDNFQNGIDFFQGTGWMNMTVMFYGRYQNSFLSAFSGWIYNLPLAYLMTSFAYLLISLYLIISTAVKIFEEGYIKGGEANAFSFSNTVFGSWDMCIMNEETAYLTSASITRELEAAVEESKRVSEKEKRTKKEKYCLRAIRVLVNIAIVIMLCGGGFAIYVATKWAIDEANSPLSKQTFRTMLINYASPITITAVNTILPTLFYKLSEFEKMNPRKKLNLDLARTVLVKLASICVLVVTIFQRNKDQKVKCWENVMGSEMYKLIWTDFIVLIFTTLVIEFPRGYIGRNVDGGCKLNEKVGIPEFHIPNNVLDLIYGQTIVWIGTFYSPLLPMMGCAKLFLAFYIKKVSLMKNFDPPKKPYRAGKSNYFFMVLQLISFTLSMVATVYAITQVTPSIQVGPFRGFNKMYDILTLTIGDLPDAYRYIFYSIFSPVVVLSIFLVLCVVLMASKVSIGFALMKRNISTYFYHAMYRVYAKSASNFQLRLQLEQQEKKKLLKQLGGIHSKQNVQDIEKGDATEGVMPEEENENEQKMFVQDIETSELGSELPKDMEEGESVQQRP